MVKPWSKRRHLHTGGESKETRSFDQCLTERIVFLETGTTAYADILDLTVPLAALDIRRTGHILMIPHSMP